MTAESPDFDAATYDERQDFVAEYGRDALDVLDPAGGERILDLGCGTGTVTADIAVAVGDPGDAVGIDASPSMIERARERHPDVAFDHADARAYVADEPFDAVFSNAALHWIDEQDAVLATVAGALGPAGRFVAEMGATGNVGGILGAVRAEGRERGVDVPTPWHFPSLGEYCTRLEDHGFVVRLARTFVRETQLDGADGLRSWLGQFGDELLAPFDDGELAGVVAAVEDRLRDERYDPDAEQWTADYRRLQFRAARDGD